MAKEIIAVRRKQIDFLRTGLVEIFEQKKPTLRDKGSFFMIFRKKREKVGILLLDGMTRGALKCQLDCGTVFRVISGRSDQKKVEISMCQKEGMTHFIFN